LTLVGQKSKILIHSGLARRPSLRATAEGVVYAYNIRSKK